MHTITLRLDEARLLFAIADLASELVPLLEPALTMDTDWLTCVHRIENEIAPEMERLLTEYRERYPSAGADDRAPITTHDPFDADARTIAAARKDKPKVPRPEPMPLPTLY